MKAVGAAGIRRTKTAGAADFLLNNLGPRARTDTGREQSVMYSVAQRTVGVVLSRDSGYVGILGKLGADLNSGFVGTLGKLGADFGHQVAGYMDLPGFETGRYDPGGCTVVFVRRHIVNSLRESSVIMSILVMGTN